MRRLLVALMVVLALVAAACSSGGDDGAEDDVEDGDEVVDRDRGDDGEGWTILAYSMADTDLEPFMVEDVNEMGNVGTSGAVTIHALVDRSVEYGEDDLLDQGAWSGARLLEIGQGSAEVLEDYGDLNLADPATLATFVAEGIDANPGTNYALIISDHGAAWPGIGPDEGADFDTLTLAEIHDGIAEGLGAAGVDMLDILGFDACLMATYEVATALADVADRMIASAELEPGHGWDYNALTAAADDPELTADELGAALVDGFEQQAAEQGTGADITLSLVDLTQIGEVDAALADFTAALVERTATVAPVVGRALPGNLAYGRSPDPSQSTHMTDLGALAAAIGIDALDVSDEADAVMRALNDVVVHKVQGPAAADFSGLSIYFPPTADLYDTEYAEIPANPSGWLTFLEAYYGAGAAIPEAGQAQFLSDATVTIDEEGLTIEALFAPEALENVADAYIEYGLIEDDGSVTYIGDESASLAGDGSGLVSGFYDLTTLNLTDGFDTVLAYLSLTSDDDEPGYSIDIPLVYHAPGTDGSEGQDILLTVVVDDDQNVVQETYYVYDEESGSFGEATLDPEGILIPEVVNYDAEGNETWLTTSDVGIFADLPNILYEFPRLESGTELFIELVVEDFGGNRAAATAFVTIP